jgi:cephalosporin hydroxylase
LSSKRKKKLKIKAGVHTMEASRRGVCDTTGARIRCLYSSWVVIGTYCIQLVILVTIIFVGSSQGRELRQAATAASRHERRLEAYTDSRSNGAPMHGPAVQSFQVSDGSWVDCIPIEQQIAAHHPALQDHIIRMQESSSTYLNLQQQNADKQSLLRKISQRTRAGCTDKSRFNWIFMKPPNCTKKRETVFSERTGKKPPGLPCSIYLHNTG